MHYRGHHTRMAIRYWIIIIISTLPSKRYISHHLQFYPIEFDEWKRRYSGNRQVWTVKKKSPKTLSSSNIAKLFIHSSRHEFSTRVFFVNAQVSKNDMTMQKSTQQLCHEFWENRKMISPFAMSIGET